MKVVTRRVYILCPLSADTDGEINENLEKSKHYSEWFSGICHIFNQYVEFIFYYHCGSAELFKKSGEEYTEGALNVCDTVAVFSPDGKLSADMIKSVEVAVKGRKLIFANNLDVGREVESVAERMKTPTDLHYVFDVDYIRNLI